MEFYELQMSQQTIYKYMNNITHIFKENTNDRINFDSSFSISHYMIINHVIFME